MFISLILGILNELPSCVSELRPSTLRPMRDRNITIESELSDYEFIIISSSYTCWMEKFVGTVIVDVLRSMAAAIILHVHCTLAKLTHLKMPYVSTIVYGRSG